MYLRILSIALLCLAQLTTFSQEQLGLRLDNYSGINSVAFNPAAHLTTPFSWDINLIAGGQFAGNNYVYLQQTSLIDLLRSPGELNIIAAPDIDDENNPTEGTIVLDYFNDGQKRFANITSDIMGPSFYVRLGDRHTIGLYTRGRFIGNTRSVTDNLSYYVYFDRKFNDDFSVDPFRMSLMSWSEVALNYMHTLPTASGRLGLAITAKYLQGYEAVYLENNTSFQLTKLPNDTLSGSPIDFRFGFTTSNLTDGNYQLKRNGSGLGIDLGMVYAFSEYGEGYRWKMGLALLDIGRISFTRNAQKHQVVSTEQKTISTREYMDFQSLEDFEEKIRFFSEQILDDRELSQQADAFSIWLPAAVSLQLDYALTPSVFLGGALVQSLPIGNIRSRRGSVLALGPRYEQRWFGASLPVSVYNWQKVRVGLALRLAFVTLGTSHLGSIVRKSDLSGTDFFFAVKVNPFNLGKGEGERSSSRKNKKQKFGKKSRVECYRF